MSLLLKKTLMGGYFTFGFTMGAAEYAKSFEKDIYNEYGDIKDKNSSYNLTRMLLTAIAWPLRSPRIIGEIYYDNKIKNERLRELENKEKIYPLF